MGADVADGEEGIAGLDVGEGGGHRQSIWLFSSRGDSRGGRSYMGSPSADLIILR
jgi:hypothetical protein